jgi:hypothetical protein
LCWDLFLLLFFDACTGLMTTATMLAGPGLSALLSVLMSLVVPAASDVSIAVYMSAFDGAGICRLTLTWTVDTLTGLTTTTATMMLADPALSALLVLFSLLVMLVLPFMR